MEEKTQAAPRKPLYSVSTVLTKKNCRAYLYALTLRRTKQALIKILLFSFVIALAITLITARGNLLMFFIYFVALLVLYALVLLISIEINLLSGQKKGTMPVGHRRTYDFYKDCIMRRNHERRMNYDTINGVADTGRLLVIHYRGDKLFIEKSDIGEDIRKGFADLLSRRLGKVYFAVGRVVKKKKK